MSADHVSAIRLIDCGQARQPECRVMISQLKADEYHWDERDHLLFLQADDRLGRQLTSLLQTATLHNVDLLIFPELAIPEFFIPQLVNWSKDQASIAIASSHYKREKEGYVTRCPVIINGQCYETEKLIPSPYERSPVGRSGLQSGHQLLKFTNSVIGNFAVMICADFLDANLRAKLSDDLDLLVVSAYQSRSDLYHQRMVALAEESEKGIYILYSNFLKKGADGRSALFGIVDHLYHGMLVKQQFTDASSPKKLYEFANGISYMIADLDLDQKRPFQNRNTKTRPNVRIVTDSNELHTQDRGFSLKIERDDDRYRKIDELYVPPKEIENMVELLEQEGVILIAGDPGMGKTYTAAWLLKHYHIKGYTIKWFSNYENVEKQTENFGLSGFELGNRQVIYIEDPFGHTQFEHRDHLWKTVKDLMERARHLDCRIIITSRTSIFERFSSESLLASDLQQLKLDLNIHTPSYDAPALSAIFHKLASFVSPWYGDIEYQHIIENAIKAGSLNTPMALREFIYATRNIVSKDELIQSINRRNLATVIDFAEEMRHNSYATQAALILVMFGGNLTKASLGQLYAEVAADLRAQNIAMNSFFFNVEIREQLGYRVEQIGRTKTIFRFLHPLYEEGLAMLIEKKPIVGIIAEKMIMAIARLDVGLAYMLINRYISRYPAMTLNLFKALRTNFTEWGDFKYLPNLATKLIDNYFNTKNKDYFELATECFPLQKAIGALNNESFAERSVYPFLRLIQRYQTSAPPEFDRHMITRIKWKRFFRRPYDLFLQPKKITPILLYCKAINPFAPRIYIEQKGPALIKRLYITIEPLFRQQFRRVFRDEKIHNELMIFDQKINDMALVAPVPRAKLFRDVILWEKKYHGKLELDTGAVKALAQRRNNLLAVGILKVVGHFNSGEVVVIITQSGEKLGVGLSEYSSRDLIKILGHHSSEFKQLLGRQQSPWAIRSDQLIRFRDQADAALWQFQKSKASSR